MLAVNTYFDLERNTSPSLKAYSFHVNTPGVPVFDRNIRGRPETQEFIQERPSILKDTVWRMATWAFVKTMHRTHKLSPLLRGPYPILEKGDRYMTLQIGNEAKKISYQQLLPAKPQVCPLQVHDRDRSRLNLWRYAKLPLEK